MAMMPPVDNSFSFRVTSLWAMCVMVQNRNRMVSELHRALRVLMATGTFSGETNALATRPIIMNSGAPGGWPTSNLLAVARNSPQSQKLAVRSMVDT